MRPGNESASMAMEKNIGNVIAAGEWRIGGLPGFLRRRSEFQPPVDFSSMADSPQIEILLVEREDQSVILRDDNSEVALESC